MSVRLYIEIGEWGMFRNRSRLQTRFGLQI